MNRNFVLIPVKPNNRFQKDDFAMKNLFSSLLGLLLVSLLLPHSAVAQDSPALCVDHHGRLVLGLVEPGKKSPLSIKQRYFTFGYFHEIASWKWQPIVTQGYDRKGWPTKVPVGCQDGDRFVYEGRISTCPYRLVLTRPTPETVRAEYVVKIAGEGLSEEEKELRKVSARGILFESVGIGTAPAASFGRAGTDLLGTLSMPDGTVTVKLENGLIERSYLRPEQPSGPGKFRAFAVAGADRDEYRLVLTLTIPRNMSVIFDNRRFAMQSDQHGWREISLAYDSYPLDLGPAVLDPPAGKHGFLTASGNHFYFQQRPGQPVFFAGTTLVHNAKFPTREAAGKLAERLAAMGCNLVRLHHLDYFLPGFGLFDRSAMAAGRTGSFDRELIDRMDYLIYCLKQKGIYIHLDGITARRFLTGDNVIEGTQLTFGLKGSAFLYDEPALMARQREYFEQLWSHFNPYTNLAYKDDPAIITASIINESDSYLHGSLDHHFPPHYRQVYRQMFADWKKRHSVLSDGQRRVEDEFRRDLMAGYFERMTAVLKKLNPVRPVCGTTWIGPERLQLLASYDHTDFTADHPYRNALLNPEELNLFNPAYRHFSYLSLAKRFDQPIMHEEWNSVGVDRAGTMALAMAVMTACDHDITILFSLFHHFDPGVVTRDILGLNIAYDPARAYLLAAMNLAFIRRDYKPNPDEYVYMLTDDMLWGTGTGSLKQKKFEEIYPSFRIASFFGRCSFAFTQEDAAKARQRNPRVIVVSPGHEPASLPGPDVYPIRSGSGELELYWKEGFALGKSPRSKMAVGNWGGRGPINLGDGISLAVADAPRVDAVLTSLSSRPLTEPTRMQLVLVGRVELQGMYTDQNGKFPVAPSTTIVAEPVRATLTLPEHLREIKVWWRTSDNRRGGSVPAQRSASGWTIQLNAPALVYEIESR